MIDADPPPDRPPERAPSWIEVFHGRNTVEGRSFRAGQSVWTVVEITREYLDRFGLPTKAVPPALEQGWLSFECGTTRRRYAPIPPNWQAMTPGELQELCRRGWPVAEAPTEGFNRSP